MNKKNIILTVVTVLVLTGGISSAVFLKLNTIAANEAVVEVEHITVNSVDEGKIKEIFVKPEQNVTSGQLIAEIEVVETVAEPTKKDNIETSKMKLQEAEENHTNFAMMYKDGVISQQEYDESLEKLVSARKTYESALNSKVSGANVSKTHTATVTKKVYAPKDGVVSMNYLVKGEQTGKNSPIILLDTDKPKIIAYFAPKFRESLKEGAEVNIKSAQYNGKVFEGVIEQIGLEPEMHSDKKSLVLPVTINFKGDISGYSFDKNQSLSVSLKR